MEPNEVDEGIAVELQSDWVRISWAADYLGLDVSTIYKRISAGRLRIFRVAPLLTLVSREQIINWQAGRMGRPPKTKNE